MSSVGQMVDEEVVLECGDQERLGEVRRSELKLVSETLHVDVQGRRGQGMSAPSIVDVGLTSEKGRELFSYLPRYYETSRVMQADMQTKGSEMDLLYQALDETLEQFLSVQRRGAGLLGAGARY